MKKGQDPARPPLGDAICPDGNSTKRACAAPGERARDHAAPAGHHRPAILLNATPANVVTVVPDRRLVMRMLLPSSSDGPLFHRIDLRVEGGSQESGLMVGTIEPD